MVRWPVMEPDTIKPNFMNRLGHARNEEDGPEIAINNHRHV